VIGQAHRRSTRVTTNKLDVLLDAEKRNSEGEIESKMATSKKPAHKNKTKPKRLTRKHAEGHGEDTDKEDLDFYMNTGSESSSSSNELSESVEVENSNLDIISNAEVNDIHYCNTLS
jgi:hypothetical protein